MKEKDLTDEHLKTQGPKTTDRGPKTENMKAEDLNLDLKVEDLKAEYQKS